MIVYRLGQALSWAAIHGVLGGMDVVGREHLPQRGPFLLVSNHESILDPFYVQVACRRPIWTMAKSTQFAGPGMQWLMPRIQAFPVRRYQIDPQAVRYALRRLEEGHGVGVYVEGERSWDGRMGRPRLGTLRLMLRAGVPIVPGRISGAYAVWPRWASRPRRGRVQVTFSEPIRYPAIRDRDERERLLPELEARLIERLTGAEPAPSVPPVGPARHGEGGGTS